ncbi:MAG: tRNA-dihydrouridine synthase [Candidatus Moranbacteria bacterium]|nr:tRNA-dihydrouridine synthase [Candidatus Moranbacteria bacterium]
MNIKVFLSPMAGITDLPFRLICKEFGADVVYSEMISSAGLFHNNRARSLQLAKSAPEEAPFMVQLFGNDPAHFSKAARIVSSLNKENYGIPGLRKPEGIDINFGCPAPKIYRQKSGCFLMREKNLSREIVQAVRQNTDLPISIKIRAGIRKTDALEFLESLADLNWKTLIIHGRTYEQGFSGKPDFRLIKQIKQNFPGKEVIANGGIFSPEDALEMVEETQADGLALARGVMGNPWLFQQIRQYLKEGCYSTPAIEEIKKTALNHAGLIKKHKGENKLIEIRKHLGWYLKNIPGAKNLRKQINSVENFKDVEKLIKNM